MAHKKQAIKKWATKSYTRQALLKRFPVGTHVSMKEIEDAYVELTTKDCSERKKRGYGRHTYLRMVDENVWRGSTYGYVKVKQDDGVWYWAKVDTIYMDSNRKGRYVVFEGSTGNKQRVPLNIVINLAEINEYVEAENS